MMYRARSNPLKSVIITILALAFVLCLLLVMHNYPLFIERFYTHGFYKGICYLLHPVFNVFPFSLGDVLYIIAVIFIFYALIRLLLLAFKRRFKSLLLFFSRIVAGFEVTLILFYLLWGMNYFRPSAAVILNLNDTTYTVANLTAVTTMLIDSTNNGRYRLTTADFQQGNEAIFAVARQAVLSLSDSSANFSVVYPKIKPSLLTPVLNYIGTSGYYNPFTSESQINDEMPVFIRPFVACHEMSHQMGYAAEDEANFSGFLAGIRSKNSLLRYSAYYLGMQEFMHALHHRDSLAYKRLKTRIAPVVKQDLKTEMNYWLVYEGKISAITSVFYDNFLKANNQPKGLRTYNQMIRLAMAYYSTQGIAYKTTPAVVNTKSP